MGARRRHAQAHSSGQSGAAVRIQIAYDPKKWEPVFGQDHTQNCKAHTVSLNSVVVSMSSPYQALMAASRLSIYFGLPFSSTIGTSWPGTTILPGRLCHRAQIASIDALLTAAS